MNACFMSPLADDAAQLPYAVDTEDVKELDEAFADLIRYVSKHSARPVIVETSADNFQVLVPKSLQSCPMWLVFLPDAFASEVEQFTTAIPRVSEVTSVDLLQRRTTLEWESATHCVCVEALDIWTSLGWACDNTGLVVVAFVTPSRMTVGTLRADDDLQLDLQIQGTRCDYNYRPVREHSDEELVAAAAQSAMVGNETWEDVSGKKLMRLAGVRYLYDQPKYW